MVGVMGGWMKAVLLTLLLLLCLSLMAAAVTGYQGRDMEGRGEEDEVPKYLEQKGLFILRRSKKVVKTDAGEVRLVMGGRWRGNPSPMHIGFITMEPNTLYIPQYVDANLILFVRKGEAKVGHIYKDELVERYLKSGHIYAIPAGSSFYIVNSGEGKRLHIICSIDTSQSAEYGANYPMSFYIGGGTFPKSVLAGFDANTLSAAFNISYDQLGMIMKSQRGGPIVHLSGEYLSSIMQLKERAVQEKEMDIDDDDEAQQEGDNSWTWPSFIDSLVQKDDYRTQIRNHKPARSPESYNLYDTKPSYQNNYGYSIAIDKHDYSPLRQSGLGIYFVNLKEGSMLSPHVNPTATEYGVVLRGSGSIQVVYPNGSAAMNAEVSEGDVFWIPRYFPFCQVASHGSPLEFFGFTTSAMKNRPQFFMGTNSLLRNMRGPELAAAFRVSEEQLESLVKAQREAVILPASAHWERKDKKKRKKGVALAMKRGLFS